VIAVCEQVKCDASPISKRCAGHRRAFQHHIGYVFEIDSLLQNSPSRPLEEENNIAPRAWRDIGEMDALASSELYKTTPFRLVSVAKDVRITVS
jgi:hypothetical protein